MCVLFSQAAAAHEARPAFLEISQTDPATYRIVWKQPTMGDRAIRLAPHLSPGGDFAASSNGWLDREPDDQYAAGGFLIRTWTIDASKQLLASKAIAIDAGEHSLAGSTVAIEGLQDTITDVLVRVRLLDGRHWDAILRPQTPELRIPAEPEVLSVPAYLLLGVKHILGGTDHLLFVLGLLLIVRDRWMLLKAVSAFTVAHSITLAAAVMAHLSLPAPFVETLIALSILFLAPEVLRARQGGTSLTIRYPWAVAFVFGLFHGMGFADGLMSAGFAHVDLAAALLMFNAGVEIGQLAFIALVLLIARASASLTVRYPQLGTRMAAYVVGICGAYWTFEAGASLLGMS
jgi:hydrogenase/urease accessory protein HupE